METNENNEEKKAVAFYDQPGVKVEQIPVGQGIPFGIERVTRPDLGIGGVYGSWGLTYDNDALALLVEERLDEPLGESRLNLSELGFNYRHSLPKLTSAENLAVEVEVGTRLLTEAARANGWDPAEVQGVLIGTSGPVSDDYLETITARAGIPASALKVSMHKACDGSVASLHLALNRALPLHRQIGVNVAEELLGKKILVGGIEGLSRFLFDSRDKNAMQIFGNGAGVIGVIPGETMKFLAGTSREVYDEEGMLQVRMYYPHSREKKLGESNVEVQQAGQSHFRVAGLMHEPPEGMPVSMAGLMGMVKLFVRSGVDVVTETYTGYQKRLIEMDMPGKQIAVAIVHHANYKINKLIDKHLQREGINLFMPWLLREFGNVSAASNMIAFLRQLPQLKPNDHVLIDGFGAGTYYDAVAVEMAG